MLDPTISGWFERRTEHLYKGVKTKHVYKSVETFPLADTF